MATINRELSQCARYIVNTATPIKEALNEIQAEVIRLALKENAYNRTYTASALELDRATLNAQIKRLYEMGLLSDKDLNL